MLDPSKATGLDGLGPKIIKLSSCILSPIIAALINKNEIKTHKYQPFLANSNVLKFFLIYKGGVKSDPINYRPILPTISKLFEK